MITKYIAIFIGMVTTAGHAADFYPKSYPAILEPSMQTHLYAENQSSIYYEVYTPALEITKKLGESIEEGEVLVRFEDTVSKANVAKTRSDLEKARVDLFVKQSLFHDRLISELELKEAEANVAGTEFSLILAEKNYAASVVRAPYNGKIAEVYIRLYEIPERGKPIIDIIDDNKLIVKFLAPAKDLAAIKDGDPIFVLLLDTQEIIETRVARISPIVNPASNTVKVEAEISNLDGSLKAGMSSLVAFTREALVIQDNSIQEILQELQLQHPQQK